MMKSKEHQFLGKPDNAWVTENKAAGLSEEEDES
jgi:hypothetical protein